MRTTTLPEIDEVPVEFLSEEEGRAMFDERARELMGISGEEFLRRYDAGEFDGLPERSEVIQLYMLIPFAR